LECFLRLFCVSRYRFYEIHTKYKKTTRKRHNTKTPPKKNRF